MQETQPFFRPLTLFERAFKPSLFDIFMIIFSVSFTALMIVGGIKSNMPSFVLSGLISAVILYGLFKTALVESTQNRLTLPSRTIIFGYKQALPVLKPTVITSDLSIRTGALKGMVSPSFVPVSVWDKQEVTLEQTSSEGKLELVVSVSLTLPSNPSAEQVENLLTLGVEGMQKVLQKELSALVKKAGGDSKVFEIGFEQLRMELLAATSNAPEVQATGISVEISGGSLSRTVSSSTGSSRTEMQYGLLHRSVTAT